MAINFDSLPKENPFGLPAPGLYLAKIVEAEMRTPKTVGNPDYLNLKYELYDKDANKVGTLYDIISESDKSVVQYKVSRFVRACGIPLSGSWELKDLAKIVLNRTIAVDVAHDKKSETPRAQVDLFSHEAYYTADEFLPVLKCINPDMFKEEPANTDFMSIPDGVDESIPFNAPDGNKASTTSEY